MQNSKTVKDGNSTAFQMAVVSDNDSIANWIVSSKRFELAVSMGQIDGVSSIDKFGVNNLITTGTDPEDIWEGGGLYTFDADGTAPIVSLASDAADTQDIKIEGLDINGDKVVQTLTLTGTTRVALSTPLWRVNRMENDGATNLTGTVFCYTGVGTVPAVGDPEVRAIIENGNNQTLMAIYTVPNGKVGFICRGELGISFTGAIGAGTQFAKMYYQSRRLGKVFKIKKVVTLINAATSNYVDDRCFPDPVPSETDIKLTVSEVSSDMGAWAALDIMLVDEDKFSVAYLQSIGQPGF